MAPQNKPTDNLRPDLQHVVFTVLGLRDITKRTGLRTTRSQNDILGALTDKDLALVACALAAAETR